MVGSHNDAMNPSTNPSTALGTRRRVVHALLFAVLIAPVFAIAQSANTGNDTAQPPLTFRVEANLVEVDAFASDAMGNPVPDLRATDFQLAADGQPQAITAFSHVNIPITRNDRPLFSPTAIEPDVETNAGIDGRIYLVVLDDLH